MQVRRPRPVVMLAVAVSTLSLVAACSRGGAVAASPPETPAVAGSTATPRPTTAPRPGATPRSTVTPGSSASSSGTTSTRVSTVAADAPSGWHVSSRTDSGPVLEANVAGPRSGVTGQVWVWLPPEYYQPAYAHTAFPVLVLHTGNTGVGENFWEEPHVEPTQQVDVQLSAAHQAHPFIMVMPVLQLSAAQDTECSDIPGEPAMGTWLGQDVPDRVRADFRTLPAPDGWGIVGASAGAFCAVKLALQRPGDYRAVVSWCGYFEPEPQTGRRWTPQEMADNSPTRMLQQHHPDLRMLLLAGDLPQFRSDRARLEAFARLAAPPTQITTYLQPGGGHFTADLRKLLPRILEFVTANLQGPSPM